MILIKPIAIDDSMIVSNTSDQGYISPAFNISTTYIAGNKVSYNNRNWECISPAQGVVPIAGDTWLDNGATNAFAMFDDFNGSVTTSESIILVEINPATSITAISFISTTAESIRITVNDPNDGQVYDETHNTNIIDSIAIDMVILNLPAGYPDATIAIGLHAVDSGWGEPLNNVQCGSLIIGTQQLLGSTQYGANVGITDYSKKGVDTFGQYTFLKRDYSRKMDVDLIIPTNQINGVLAILAQYRSTPCVWVGGEDHPSTIIFGFYKDFNINLKNAINSDCSVQIEGLT